MTVGEAVIFVSTTALNLVPDPDTACDPCAVVVAVVVPSAAVAEASWASWASWVAG